VGSTDPAFFFVGGELAHATSGSAHALLEAGISRALTEAIGRKKHKERKRGAASTDHTD
jgi:hypothetical protein